MSIWISDLSRAKILFSLSALVVLTACGVGRFGKSSSPSFTTRSATIDVAGKSVVVEGPRGFCMDKKTSETGGDTAFVLLGNCKVISPGFRSPSPQIKALLTASVARNTDGLVGVSNSAVSLDRFFRSETGRTALSRSSDPGTVQILDSFERNGIFYLHASDSSPGIAPGASDDYWRTFFDLQDLVASISVIGFRSDPLTPEKGLATAEEFTRLLRLRNGVPASTEAPVMTTPVRTASTARPTPVTAQPTATPQPQPLAETTATNPPVASEPIVKRKPRNAFWSLGLLRKLVN